MHSFHILLMITQATMQKKIMHRLTDTPLTLGQPKVLEYLQAHDGAHPGEIAKNCHIEAPSLTSILNRMEQQGLIERRTLPDDRRSVYVFATERGKSFQGRIADEFAGLEEQAFQGFSKKERADFMSALEKIYGNLYTDERGV